MKWGYVRTSTIPLKTRSGSSSVRKGLLYVLSEYAGDEVYVFSHRNLEDREIDSMKNVHVINDYEKAKECDVLIVEGAETACRPMANVDHPIIYHTQRADILKVLKHYKGHRIILQIADPSCPPILFAEMSSYQYGDISNIDDLRDRTFIGLIESGNFSRALRHISCSRAPMDLMVQNKHLFMWNAVFAEIYIRKFVPENRKKFEERPYDYGYYGRPKYGRFGVQDDTRNYNPHDPHGSLYQIHHQIQKRDPSMRMKIFTRNEGNLQNLFPPGVIDVNPTDQIYRNIRNLKSSIVFTDENISNMGVITTRVSESAILGTPLALVPGFHEVYPLVLNTLKKIQDPEERKLAIKCVPKYGAAYSKSWESFYEKIIRLARDKNYFNEIQEHQYSLSNPNLIEDTYNYFVKCATCDFNEQESQTNFDRFENYFRRIILKRELKKKFIFENVFKRYLIKYKRVNNESH